MVYGRIYDNTNCNHTHYECSAFCSLNGHRKQRYFHAGHSQPAHVWYRHSDAGYDRYFVFHCRIYVKEKAEDNLIDIIKKEREENKKKIMIEVLIGIPCIVSMLSLFIMAGLLNIEDYQRIIMLVIGFICVCCSVIGLSILDRNIGYYECKHCKERFIPTFGCYINGLHGITWRRLRCPSCGKVSNCRKKLNK